MNFLREIIRRTAQPTSTKLLMKITHQQPVVVPSICDITNKLSCMTIQGRETSSLQRMHRTGPHIKPRIPKRPLDGNPFMKGVVLKTLIKKPKKPNSANRKCVLVRLSNGKELVAYVPGIGHNLQEHSIVLCQVGRLKDCPGVKIRCVRGKYDLGHVIKK